METVIWFAPQVMPGFYMECYAGLKWVKREYSLLKILNLNLRKCFLGSFASRTQNSCENSKPFWLLPFGEGQLYAVSLRRVKDIQHSMSMVVDTMSHVCFIMIVYYKMRQILFQNAAVTLLQNATEVYYKMRQVFYYKSRQYTHSP